MDGSWLLIEVDGVVEVSDKGAIQVEVGTPVVGTAGPVGG